MLHVLNVRQSSMDKLTRANFPELIMWEQCLDMLQRYLTVLLQQVTIKNQRYRIDNSKLLPGNIFSQ